MGANFPRVGIFKYGYSRKEVDEFLAEAKEAYANFSLPAGEFTQQPDLEIRQIVFAWRRNGYSPQKVDAALDRLELAFVQRQRAAVVSSLGEEAWLEYTYKSAEDLYPRMLRPHGERFANARRRGYDKAEVDAFIDRITNYFDGKSGLSISEIRNVTFRKARRRKAYSEAVVDVYLDRVISVLLAVE